MQMQNQHRLLCQSNKKSLISSEGRKALSHVYNLLWQMSCQWSLSIPKEEDEHQTAQKNNKSY